MTILSWMRHKRKLKTPSATCDSRGCDNPQSIREIESMETILTTVIVITSIIAIIKTVTAIQAHDELRSAERKLNLALAALERTMSR